MTEIKNQLFDAFREDHAGFGRGLHRLATSLRAADEAGARAAADQVNREAGAHIAFEEEDFYPALKPYLSAEELQQMYVDHADTRALLNNVRSLKAGALSDCAYRNELISAVESAEEHVAECGELFGVMGSLSEDEQASLLVRLKQWRKKRPRWLDLSETNRQ